MATSVTRRGWLLAIVPTLGGCGFQPLYGTSQGDRVVSERLGEIQVGLIPERSGQLLRQALVSRLERDGAKVAKRFDLLVQLSLTADPNAIQLDNSASRVRLIGIATWMLVAQDAQKTTVASGSARELDGYNIVNQQFFSAELASSAVQRRMMDALADQITIQIAIYINNISAL